MFIKIWMCVGIIFEIAMIVLGQTTRIYDLKVVRCKDRSPKFSIVPSPRNGHLALPYMAAASVEVIIILVFFAIESAGDLIAFCGGRMIPSLAVLSIGTFAVWITLWLSAVLSAFQHDGRVEKLIGTEKGDALIERMKRGFSCELSSFLSSELESEAPVEKRFPIQSHFLH